MTPIPTKTPLGFLEEFLPSEVHNMERETSRLDVPEVIALADLKTPVYGNDPSELLQHRFLYKGGIAMLCGPTGIGKSSLLMQAAMHWALGRGLFGVVPGDIYQAKGMRILLVQAENDKGDLAEMRDGVLAGCEDLIEDEKARAGRQIKIATITDKTSDAFAAVLESLIVERGPFDLVMVDPAFAYLGGDASSQRDVSHFMRELLNPLVQYHQVGLVLAHHTNKPLRGKEKDSWAAGDFAYLGAGSAEWINPARAALAIRSIGSDSTFEFRAVKRGKRLRWEDADGLPTNVQHIAHHGDRGVICWRSATPEEVEALQTNSPTPGRPSVCSTQYATRCVAEKEGQNQSFYKSKIAAELGCSLSAVQNAIKAALADGYLTTKLIGRSTHYFLTDIGRRWTQTARKELTNDQKLA